MIRRPTAARLLVRRWLVGAVVTGLGACAVSPPVVVSFSDHPQSHGASEYGEVYERWTRHGKVIHELDSALEVWATFKSADYREAFVALYGEEYRLDDAARQSILTAQREANTTSYEFVVTAQSATYKWNDLERKGSAWRVTLRDGQGHEMAPEKIAVEKFPEMYERQFFPVKTPFTRTYSVRFPRRSGAAAAGAARAAPDGDPAEEAFVSERSGKLVLRFAGPFGAADLVWSARAGS